jgi:flagellum-specific ATP synthase
VLVDGDDMNEPIADAVRSILDGHIVLTRSLAHSGHYPAIDVLQSVSRLVGEIVAPEIREAGTRLRSALAAYREKEDLISIGAYQPGTDPLLDAAIALRPAMDDFLRQRIEDQSTAHDADEALLSLAAQLPGTGDLTPAVHAPVEGTVSGIATPAVPLGAPGGAPAAIPSLALNS